ncbi:hypothetical protein AC579_3568 [Pseudocercospora musae]|uniref:Uncharacterized protein n=1 Tax=Pseudocercospora musae TaxID=113226 RepID=A0A139IWF5_9PEZI|nr:hypothetical protein AC579_3568 [Pseudocercospora musae]
MSRDAYSVSLMHDLERSLWSQQASPLYPQTSRQQRRNQGRTQNKRRPRASREQRSGSDVQMPNGRGGAFLMSQRKALFGATPQVTRISAWGNTQHPDMLFDFGTSEGDIPSTKLDPNAPPYNYLDQQAAVPCFMLPCDDSEKRRMALRERAKL